MKTDQINQEKEGTRVRVAIRVIWRSVRGGHI